MTPYATTDVDIQYFKKIKVSVLLKMLLKSSALLSSTKEGTSKIEQQYGELRS